MLDGSTPEPPRTARPGGSERGARVGPETKRRYLQAGAELAVQSSPGRETFAYAVSRVTMADVATDLGIARTTLYKWWPSKLDFWADLTTYIASIHLGPTADEVASSILAANAAHHTPHSAMEQARVLLNALQASQLENPWLALRTALLAYGGNDDLQALVAATNTRWIDETTVQVERILAGLGVVPREPLSARDIAVVGFCVADGLATGGRLSPRVNADDIALDGEPPGWGMLAFALRGIIRRCTRPRTEADAGARSVGRAPRQPPLVDPTARWTETQRSALAAGAHRFVAAAPSTGSGRPAGPLGHVTIARLARHTGVSRQSLHRIWPSQQSFVADLIPYLFEERCEQVLATMRQALRRSMEVPFGGSLVATEDAVIRLIRDASRGPLAHLAYVSHEDDLVIRERCRVALESMLDRFTGDLTHLTHSWGGSTRDGVEFLHLATIIVLTELAAARLQRTNPGSVRVGLAYRGGNWSTLAIMIEGIVGYALGLPIEEHPAVDSPGRAL